jgi:hypothetical protein
MGKVLGPCCKQCGKLEVIFSMYGEDLKAKKLAGLYCLSCLTIKLRKEDDDLPPLP